MLSSVLGSSELSEHSESCQNSGFRLAYHTWQEAAKKTGDKLALDSFESKDFLFQTRDFSRSQPHVPTPGKAFAQGMATCL